MPSYLCSKKIATIHDLASHATLLANMQYVSHSSNMLHTTNEQTKRGEILIDWKSYLKSAGVAHVKTN